MRLFFTTSLTKKYLTATQTLFHDLMTRLVAPFELVSRWQGADVALFSGWGRELAKKVTRAKRSGVKTFFFLSPSPELGSDIHFFFSKRHELKVARKADVILVSSFAEKELLIDGGYPHVELVKGIIGDEWYKISNDDILMASRTLSLGDTHLVVGGGSVATGHSGVTDFINIALRFPAIRFVYFNLFESGSRTLRLATPDNFTYYSGACDALVRGAIALSDLVVFTDYNQNRPWKVYQSLAAHAQVIVRDNGVVHEDLISGRNVYKCVSVDDYCATIMGVLEGVKPRTVFEADSYRLSQGQATLTALFEEAVNAKKK